MKTIGEIKTEFLNTGYAGWQELCDVYRSDERAGVTKLVQQYEKKIQNLENEKIRMQKMMEYEHKYEHLGYL